MVIGMFCFISEILLKYFRREVHVVQCPCGVSVNRTCIMCIGTFADIVKRKCSKLVGKVGTKGGREIYRRVMMEGMENTVVYEQLERRQLMESTEVLLDLCLGKWSPFVEAGKLNENGRLLNMCSICIMTYYTMYIWASLCAK